MAISQSFVTTPAVTATGTLKRTVSDQIRRLNPAITPVMSLVKSADVDAMGEPSYGKGLINKEKTDTMKFEWYTLTPIDIYFTTTGDGTTCTVGQHTGTALLADTSAFVVRDVVINLSTMEMGVVNTITANTSITVTAIGAGWSSSTGDVIALACNTHEEGSSTSTSRTKEPDNNYNYVFPFRFAVSIADTAINSPHYGGPLLQRYMTDNMYFALRNIENSLILGKRAASGDTTTVTISATNYSMFTTRGLWTFASDTFNAGGTVTFDDFQSKLFLKIPKTQSPDAVLKMVCGRNIYSRMIQWANNKLIYMENGEPDVMGVRPKKFYCGAYTIEPMLHDLFDQGAMANNALIFDTSDIVYRFKTGMDLQPKDNIQLPATWGTTRELRGVVGIQSISGGANVLQITNWAS